jgi:hypothetical protein
MDSDTAAVRTPAQAFIVADAMSRPKEWDGNLVQAMQVLNNSRHAMRYFESCWFNPGEWQIGKSGKQNMNYASRMRIEGDRTTTKETTW